MKAVELRCLRHWHALLMDGVIEIRCRQCSKDQGRPVYHYWDAVTGEPLDPPSQEEYEAADKAA